MTQTDYTATISAGASAREAVESICRVSDWWTKGFTGAADKKGDAFTIRFGDTFVDFQVVELTPAKRVEWRVTDCDLHFSLDRKEWNGTRIVWDVSPGPGGGSTVVRMTHVGLVPACHCYRNCEAGWDFYVKESLRSLLIDGMGLPDGKGRAVPTRAVGPSVPKGE